MYKELEAGTVRYEIFQAESAAFDFNSNFSDTGIVELSKGSNAPSLNSLAEERMRPNHWLGMVL